MFTPITAVQLHCPSIRARTAAFTPGPALCTLTLLLHCILHFRPICIFICVCICIAHLFFLSLFSLIIFSHFSFSFLSCLKRGVVLEALALTKRYLQATLALPAAGRSFRPRSDSVSDFNLLLLLSFLSYIRHILETMYVSLLPHTFLFLFSILILNIIHPSLSATY